MSDSTNHDANYPVFTGSAEARAEPQLPPPLERTLRESGNYVPSTELQCAVEVALMLGQPLLLTGEPGTGKTTLAAALAHERFDDRLLAMGVKSDSRREDLLYRINDLAIFRDSQPGRQSRRLLDYLTIGPFGEAILRACPPETELRNRIGGELRGSERALAEIFGGALTTAVPTVADLLPDRKWEQSERVVVLIDEIDKAPRDLPNDLLEEFDRMSFAIPEFDISVQPPDQIARPVVIITSNGERSLPDAFLRRCAYHHISFPSRDQLLKIIDTRLANLRLEGRRRQELLTLFDQMRARMERPPGTVELLQWLSLAANYLELGDDVGLTEAPSKLQRLVAVLAKTESDITTVRRMIYDWRPER